MRYDLQWISQHAAQSYPLTDQAYALGQLGKQVPMSFLLDAQIKVPARSLQQYKQAFYVKSIIDSLDTYTLVIGCHIDNGVDFPCLRAYGISKDLDLGSDIQDRYYILVSDLTQVPDAYKKTVQKITGIVYIGVTNNIQLPTLQLQYQQGQLSPLCVQGSSGVDAIIIGDSLLQGVVYLRAGSGINITADKQSQKTVVTVSVDQNTVYSGASSVQQAVQAIKDALGQPIKSINGVRPDSTGNIHISGIDCVLFDPSAVSPNVITVSNTCSKPCCGDVYSQQLKNQIQLIKEQQSILRDYFIQQANNVNYLQGSLATVIGAR